MSKRIIWALSVFGVALYACVIWSMVQAEMQVEVPEEVKSEAYWNARIAEQEKDYEWSRTTGEEGEEKIRKNLLASDASR